VSVSANGRYLAFESYAQLVPADTNGRRDIYVLDRATGKVTLETALADGRAAEADSGHPGLSADGELLVYQTNLPSFSDSPTSDIVLRRRTEGRATVITALAGPESPRLWNHSPVVSGNGRIVVFVSSANLIAGAAGNGRQELYAYDVVTGLLRRVASHPSTRSSVAPAVTHDARYVSFTSISRGTSSEVIVCDTTLNVVRPIHGDRVPNGASWDASMDAAGRHVAFVSASTNLASGDRNRAPDVFVADLESGEIELISRSAGGGTANGASGAPALSADGRFVAFQSDASDLICAKNCDAREDVNLLWDVFVYDRSTRTMTRLSADGANGWIEPSVGPALDARGDVIAFSSRHPIDGSDVRNDFDVFVRVNGQNAFHSRMTVFALLSSRNATNFEWRR
jgi:Tol biopolymer transport system component